MAKRTFTEEEIKRIAAKYIRSVQQGSEPVNIPDMITEAIKTVAPDRKVDDSDIASVVTELSKHSVVTDKLITETVKKVVDDSAFEDLKFLVRRNIREIGKRPSEKDVEEIIKRGKLDPHASSINDIRAAVKSYFTTGKSLEHQTPDEIQAAVKAQLQKYGPVDDSILKQIVNDYVGAADQEKPINPDELQSVIRKYVNLDEPPSPTPLNRGRRETKHDIKQVQPGAWVPPKNPRTPTFFEKVRLKLKRYGIRSLTRGSRNWLKDTIYSVSKAPSRQKLIAEGTTVADVLIGRMFMYFYDAKTKKKLPYWDKFPLIFVIELYEDGWLGVNLHYLPLILRAKLFDKLLQFANNKSLDRITKLRLSYNLLKNFSQFPEVKPCLKRYLSGQVKSGLRLIDPVDWEIALFLPVEQFQKETKEHVWGESRKMVRRERKR